MGCCESKNGDSRANQFSRWRSTGIVALRDSKLKVFPKEIFDLASSVRTLDLTGNTLVEIPQEIEKLVNIQRMILVNNHIVRLPMSVGHLRTIKFLALDGNRMEILPDELDLLVKLEHLSVKQNVLTCLPNTIGNMCNLVLLNVSENKMQSLPESIGNCKSLEELHANGNLLVDLPPSVCGLVRLKSLILNNNKLQKLPQKLLRDCLALQNISLHGNPISLEEFQQMDGFQEFEARRKKKFDKQIDSNILMNSAGLDEGVDRH